MSDEIDDGFGSVWLKCHPNCGMEVVRPGKAQCWCDPFNDVKHRILDIGDDRKRDQAISRWYHWLYKWVPR